MSGEDWEVKRGSKAMLGWARIGEDRRAQARIGKDGQGTAKISEDRASSSFFFCQP